MEKKKWQLEMEDSKSDDSIDFADMKDLKIPSSNSEDEDDTKK